jgi:hypothetical protein
MILKNNLVQLTASEHPSGLQTNNWFDPIPCERWPGGGPERKRMSGPKCRSARLERRPT